MTLSDLDTAYITGDSVADKDYNWYAKRRWKYVAFSWMARGLAAISLV
jgi:hypothetical protein